MRRQIAYNMDCMDLMKLLPDNEFDLAIVDPPYGGEYMPLAVDGLTDTSRKTKRQKQHHTGAYLATLKKSKLDARAEHGLQNTEAKLHNGILRRMTNILKSFSE